MAKRAPPQLPLDVLVSILSHLPAERTRADYSARTIARFSTCCRLFHDATSLPTLWEPHYAARFIHCNEVKELQRDEDFGQNWRLRYHARKRQEMRALEVVRQMIENRKTRQSSVEELTELSADVWDVLSLEYKSPLPPSFRESSNWGPDHGKVPARPLSWRYWSEQASIIICRHYAVSQLQRVKEMEGTDDAVLFEQAMTLLSCFFSVLSDEVMEMLDALADACEQYMEGIGRILDADHPGYSPTQICKDICIFLSANGFRLPTGQNFRALMNHFPHAYITTNRRTIPISLVHLFIYVARRLDLEAYPVNFPTAVMARINIRGSSAEGNFFLVNPCSQHPDEYIMTPPFNFVPAVPFEVLLPSPTAPMLARAARNILASLADRDPPSSRDANSASFCAMTLILLFEPNDGPIPTLFKMVRMLPPIECYTLSTTLVPLLNEHRSSHLQNYCQRGLTQERREAFAPTVKHHTDENVKYFVGMVFRHRKQEYYACIVGWDEEFDVSRERQVTIHPIDSEKRRNQPFYYALRLDSITLDESIQYVSQEHIQLIPVTAELAKVFVTDIPEITRHFSDVLLSSKDNERGVFRLSPEAKQAYPDDDWYGTRWVQEGREAASEQLAAVEAFTKQFKDLL